MPKRPSSIEYRKNLKQKILEVSLDMFRTKGLKAVKMDDIAKRLSISKRTLYEIYPKKETIAYEALKTGSEMRRKTLKEAIEKCDDIMDIFAAYFKSHIADIKSTNPVLLEDINNYPMVKHYFEAQNKEHAKFSIEFYQRGKAEGYFIDNVNYEIIKEISSGTSNYIASNMLYMRFTPSEILHSIIIMYVRSVCTEEGMKRIDKLLETI